MESIIGDVGRWASLTAADLAQLQTVAQILRTNGVFAHERANLVGWNQKLRQMARNEAADTRWAAAYLVSTTARTAHASVVVACAETWAQLVLPLLKTNETDYVKSVAASAICDILQHSRGNTQVLKVDTTMVLSKLMPALAELRSISSLRLAAMVSTYSLMRVMTNSLRPHLERIEADCMAYLSSYDASIQQAAALCVGCIPACKATTKNDYSEWGQFLHLLLLQVHGELDNILPATGGAAGMAASSVIVSSEVDITDTRRYSGLCQAIAATINLPLSIGMPPMLLPVGAILSKVVFRVLQVTEADSPANNKLLPRLHIDALKLLAAVVSSTGRRLLPFASTLGELLGLCIGRTAQTLLGRAHGVIESAYRCTEICLQHLGSAIGDNLIEPKIVGHLLAEIDNHMVALQRDTSQEQSTFAQSMGSGKKRKKERRPSYQQNGSETASVDWRSIQPYSIEFDCHLSGIRLLRTIVCTSGVALPVADRLHVDRAVVRWLTNYGDTNSRPAYNFGAVRLCCYELLTFSLTHPVGPARTLPDDNMLSGLSRKQADTGSAMKADLLPIARQLFASGACDQDAAIATACCHGLRLCEMQAHGRARPLYFAPVGTYATAPIVPATAASSGAELANPRDRMAASFGSSVGSEELRRERATGPDATGPTTIDGAMVWPARAPLDLPSQPTQALPETAATDQPPSVMGSPVEPPVPQQENVVLGGGSPTKSHDAAGGPEPMAELIEERQREDGRPGINQHPSQQHKRTYQDEDADSGQPSKKQKMPSDSQHEQRSAIQPLATPAAATMAVGPTLNTAQLNGSECSVVDAPPDDDDLSDDGSSASSGEDESF